LNPILLGTITGVAGFNSIPVDYVVTDCKLMHIDGPVAVDPKNEAVFPDLHTCVGCANCNNCLIPVYCSTCAAKLARRRALIRFSVEYYQWGPFDYNIGRMVFYGDDYNKNIYSFTETYETPGVEPLVFTGLPTIFDDYVYPPPITVHDTIGRNILFLLKLNFYYILL
jgi:hypothetical protein